MSASEFAFLALGLVLGAASGAALVEVLRSRPPTRREVRVTVAPNSIPRRASTLTDTDPVDRGPARGGPADRRWVDRDMPPADAAETTYVTSPVPPDLPPIDATPARVPVAVGPPAAEPRDRTPVPSGPSMSPFRISAAGGAAGAAIALSGSRSPIGISIAREPDPMVAALRATAASTAVAAMRRGGRKAAGGDSPTDERGRAGVAVAAAKTKSGPAADGAGGAVDASATAPDDPGSGGGAPDDTCAEQRRVADERCEIATRAREGAAAAAETLRASQRTYDDLINRSEIEAAAADPRAVREAKEAAQRTFRHARSMGRTHDDVEAAARDWLTEINRINLATRESTAAAERNRKAAAEIAPSLERLAVEADAARISAEVAEEACVAAREAVAACQEAAALAAAGGTATAAGETATAVEDEDALATPMGSRAGEDAAIIRLLRGDRDVMSRLVARLGGDDEESRRHWQVVLGDFVEALVGRAIEASAFDFPETGSFWSMFTRSQARDIAGALASLGYRHDGFGGWAEDRVPSQRDLSLAVGYAGLDPMRIRVWPSEREMTDILRNVTVAADEYVWEAAGGLTLGEMISLLGRRADALTELWNEWGTIRPMLLSAE
ncbi:MAG TPA: hypothetical protein VFV72_05600 [Candidatus Limnocylindrales bacterium]|nr:hypothetical protein [Candidatus Limnocylindrales bacterium]